jgi:hypothetical protein
VLTGASEPDDGQVEMTATYLVLATLAALGFYLSCAHQQLWPRARSRARAMRMAARIITALATLAAVAALGLWAGVFAALTVVMLDLVLLPYLDAWWQIRREGQRAR